MIKADFIRDRFSEYVIGLLLIPAALCSQDHRVVHRVDGRTVTVDAIAPSIFHVSVAPQDFVRLRPELSVIARPGTFRRAISRTDSVLVLRTDSISAVMHLKDGTIDFRDAAGDPFLHADGPGRSSFVPFTTAEDTGFSVLQHFTLRPDEAVYGLGQFEDPIMNYRGSDLRLSQANRTSVNPFLISTRRYGILWHNSSASRFCDTLAQTFFWSEVADQIDYYVVHGGTMDSVIAGYRLLTGQAPLFGKWAYGFWQSKERYKTSSELLEVIKEYRRRGIPIDNIVQDWSYWGGMDKFSGMVWDSTAYPTPALMVDSLHLLHAHLTVSIWPAFGRNTEIFHEMSEKRLLYPGAHWNGGLVYDAYNPAARDVYWKYLKQGLADVGVDGFWMDASEPEFRCTDDRYATAMSMTANGRNWLGSFSRYLNTYSLLTTQGVYEHHRADVPGKRAFILTRSAFTGQQRYAAVTWSGDTFASWDNLRVQIASGINFSLSGIPYWSHDIGGFNTEYHFPRGLQDPAYRELFVRWLQFGAFSPLFRVHGTNIPREIWRFGEPGISDYDALAAAIRLRYRLLPYIYSTAWSVTDAGGSFLRALAMEAPADQCTHGLADEFMFGATLLVHAITHPVQHAPDFPGIDITPDHFYGSGGSEHGLTMSVFRGTDFTKVISVRKMDVSQLGWAGCLPEGLDTSYSLRLDGMVKSEQKGTYKFFVITDGGVRLWINGTLLIDARENAVRAMLTGTVDFAKRTKYTFRLEHTQPHANSALLKIDWQPPGEGSCASSTISTYLPATRDWYDFWTGVREAAGTNVATEASLQHLPMFVPAGSILPLGPDVQYAQQNRADTLEIRIYSGANGSFRLYDDEGDGYGYEHGARSIIPVIWNDHAKQLTIKAREGSYPGMSTKRLFKLVMVRPGHGTGADLTPKPDRIVTYDGSAKTVSLR